MNSEIQFIDTHAHMYDVAFMSEIDVFVSKAQQQKVNEIYLPNCDQHTISPMMQIVEMYPEVFKPMMGLHPCYVKEDYMDELSIVKQWLDKYDFAAVGEIGLDYYWDKTYVANQKAAFELQIDWALEKDLPIIIHTRESIDDGIEIVRKKQNGNLKGVFHCFSGTLEQAEKIVDMGFYLGIGGVVTYKKSELPLIVKQIDLQYLVLETDAPYLAPVPYRGKTNESSYIPFIAQKIADIKQISLEKVSAQTTKNARNIFKY